MNRILLSIICFFLGSIGYAQELDLLLSLEQILASDNILYFKVTLTNQSPNARYFFTPLSDAAMSECPEHAILVPEYECKDGSVKEGVKQGFFYVAHEGMDVLIIPPQGGSYSCQMPFNHHPESAGMIKRADIDKVKKVRVRLEKVFALKSREANWEKVETTLYSNWVDINLSSAVSSN